MEGLFVIFAVVATVGVVAILRGIAKSAEHRIDQSRGQPSRRLPPRSAAEQTTVYSDGWETREKVEVEPFLSIEAVGESFHIETIRLVDAGRLDRGEDSEFRAILIPEERNPHDPAATAIWADGFGLVGHIGRSDVWKIRPLRKQLVETKTVAVLKARLVGGWGEDDNGRTFPPGVVVYINDEVSDPATSREEFPLAANWRVQKRAEFASSRPKDVSVIGEGKFQAALRQIIQAVAVSPPTPFSAILVPARVDPFETDPTLVVCHENEGPVGSLSYSTARRYRRAIDLLSERGEVGVCKAVCIPEGKGYGVKIRLPSPEEAEAAVASRALN